MMEQYNVIEHRERIQAMPLRLLRTEVVPCPWLIGRKSHREVERMTESPRSVGIERGSRPSL